MAGDGLARNAANHVPLSPVSFLARAAELGSWFTITQGAIFVVCVLAFRKGIIGELEAWLRRRRGG